MMSNEKGNQSIKDQNEPPKRERNKADEVSFQVWGIPMSLRRRFKMACARKGETMKEAIIELMQDYIKR